MGGPSLAHREQRAESKEQRVSLLFGPKVAPLDCNNAFGQVGPKQKHKQRQKQKQKHKQKQRQSPTLIRASQ